jgi:hypothetical protein
MSEILHSSGPMMGGILMYKVGEFLFPIVHNTPIIPQASIMDPP